MPCHASSPRHTSVVTGCSAGADIVRWAGASRWGAGCRGERPSGNWSKETALVLGKGACPEEPPPAEDRPLVAWPGGL